MARRHCSFRVFNAGAVCSIFQKLRIWLLSFRRSAAEDELQISCSASPRLGGEKPFGGSAVINAQWTMNATPKRLEALTNVALLDVNADVEGLAMSLIAEKAAFYYS